MKRGGPLKRTSGLKRTELKKRSPKRSAHMRDQRVPLIEALVEAGVGCEVGMVLDHYHIPGAERCNGNIQGMHERRKSSSGGSRVNIANLIPACIPCNGLIEDEAGLVRERTGDLLVVREGDPEWERLGARNDRSPALEGEDDLGTA